MARFETPYYFYTKHSAQSPPQSLDVSRIDWDSFKIDMERERPWDLYAITITFDYHLRAHESVPTQFRLGSRIVIRKSSIAALGNDFVGRMEAPGIEPMPGGRAVIRVRATDWVYRAQQRKLPKDVQYAGRTGEPGWHLYQHCRWLSGIISDDPMMDFTGNDGLPSKVFPYTSSNYPGTHPGGTGRRVTSGLTSVGEGLTIYEMLRRIAHSSGAPYMKRTTNRTPPVTFNDAVGRKVVAQFDGSRIELSGEWRQSSDGYVTVARVGRMQGIVRDQDGSVLRDSTQVDHLEMRSSESRINAVGLIEYDVDTIWNQAANDPYATTVRAASGDPFVSPSGVTTRWAPKELTVKRASAGEVARVIDGGPIFVSGLQNHAIPYGQIDMDPLHITVTMDPSATSFLNPLQMTIRGNVISASNRAANVWGEMPGSWALTIRNWEDQ